MRDALVGATSVAMLWFGFVALELTQEKSDSPSVGGRNALKALMQQTTTRASRLKSLPQDSSLWCFSPTMPACQRHQVRWRTRHTGTAPEPGCQSIRRGRNSRDSYRRRVAHDDTRNTPGTALPCAQRNSAGAGRPIRDGRATTLRSGRDALCGG